MLDPIVLSIAKTAILSQFDAAYTIDTEELVRRYPFLEEPAATFVTLDKNTQLRGCIGTIVAYRRLIDDLIENARSAAFGDPRFAPLRTEELKENVELEVSLLSKPQPIAYESFEDLAKIIVPGKDGLILRHGKFQGTFLPQVWEQLHEPKTFLEHLAYKAGADPSIYRYRPEIYRYRVDHIKDRWDAIRTL